MNVYHVHTDKPLNLVNAAGEPVPASSYVYVLAVSFEEALAKVRAAHPDSSVRQISRTNHVHGAAVIV